jgi:multidrug efflux pump subunit AcrB
VRVEWRGAAAEDVEEGLTTPLEQKLKSVSGIKHVTSTSSQGISSISIEFKEGTDPISAVDEVKQAVDQFRNLPQDAEPPEVSRVIRYEPIARHPADRRQLAGIAPAGAQVRAGVAWSRHRQGRSDRIAG